MFAVHVSALIFLLAAAFFYFSPLQQKILHNTSEAIKATENGQTWKKNGRMVRSLSSHDDDDGDDDSNGVKGKM